MNGFNYVPCHICKRPADDRHHVFGGRLRQLSEQYGMVMHLCRHCHVRLHKTPQGEWKKYKQEHQKKFDLEHGKGEFLRIFGRNYL